MRITPGLLRARATADLQRASRQLADLQRQITTGRRFDRASADPLAAGDVLAAVRGRRELEQAERSQGVARSRLETEDAALNTVADLLARAKELAFSQGDAGATPATRQAAAVELNQMIDQLTALANTRIGTEFVFGGEVADAAPFQGTTYVGGSIERRVEILPGQELVTAKTARTLFVDSGVLSSLVDLRDALLTGQADPVVAAVGGLDAAMTATETHLAESGARLRRLEVAETAVAEQEALLLARQDLAGGVEAEEAFARFVATETALQTSAAALQRVLTLNLAQFLGR